MAKLLAIRFSALGDVAMTLPVLYSFASAYPQHTVVMVSRKGMAPLFADCPVNIHFRGIDLKAYRGLAGLNRLYHELRSEEFDAVVDLHDVLRSKYLRWRFRLHGTPVASIDKGRADKHRLIARHHKVLRQLPSSFSRYQTVFAKSGYTFPLRFHSVFGEGKGNSQAFAQWTGSKGDDRWIGIAPFAAHRGKILPVPLMEKVLQQLSSLDGMRLFLFGGGKQEKERLESWQETFPHTLSMAGKLKLNEEIALMSHLDVMISMDSGNMHLASLAGTPVVSVWGATHPYAGFMGWGQSEQNAVQASMECRPCSIYGNKPCFRGDYACLWSISPEEIVRKVMALLDKGNTLKTLLS